MQFIANRPVVPDLVTAIALDDYLRYHPISELPWVPAKERSVEIFGHGQEKKLERIAEGSGWFTDGGLTLAAFRCFQVPRQPVHALFPSVKPGGLIISENEAGFHSLCRAAKVGTGFSCIVFGDGSEVLRVVEFLREKTEELEISEVFYLGDVDRRGLEIPVSLRNRLQHFGIALVPWEVGYRALLAEVKGCNASNLDLVNWLPSELRTAADHVLSTRGHCAQEVFGWTALAREWHLSAEAGYIPPATPL